MNWQQQSLIVSASTVVPAVPTFILEVFRTNDGMVGKQTVPVLALCTKLVHQYSNSDNIVSLPETPKLRHRERWHFDVSAIKVDAIVVDDGKIGFHDTSQYQAVFSAAIAPYGTPEEQRQQIKDAFEELVTKMLAEEAKEKK